MLHGLLAYGFHLVVLHHPPSALYHQILLACTRKPVAPECGLQGRAGHALLCPVATAMVMFRCLMLVQMNLHLAAAVTTFLQQLGW